MPTSSQSVGTYLVAKGQLAPIRCGRCSYSHLEVPRYITTTRVGRDHSARDREPWGERGFGEVGPDQRTDTECCAGRAQRQRRLVVVRGQRPPILDSEQCVWWSALSQTRAAAAAKKRDGDIEIAARTWSTLRTVRSTLHFGSTGDEHDSAALYLRADGRYLRDVLVARHRRTYRWRVTESSRRCHGMGDRTRPDNGTPTTYTNIFAVPDENRLYGSSAPLNATLTFWCLSTMGRRGPLAGQAPR